MIILKMIILKMIICPWRTYIKNLPMTDVHQKFAHDGRTSKICPWRTTSQNFPWRTYIKNFHMTDVHQNAVIIILGAHCRPAIGRLVYTGRSATTGTSQYSQGVENSNCGIFMGSWFQTKRLELEWSKFQGLLLVSCPKSTRRKKKNRTKRKKTGPETSKDST